MTRPPPLANGLALLAPMVVGAALAGCAAFPAVNFATHTARPAADDIARPGSGLSVERPAGAKSPSGETGLFAAAGQPYGTPRIDTGEIVLATLAGAAIGRLAPRKTPNAAKRFSSGTAFSHSASVGPPPLAYAITGFAMGSAFASWPGHALLMPATAYAIAALAGADRPDDRRRAMSEAFVASAIGYAAGKLAIRHDVLGTDRRLRFRPYLKRRGVGVRVVYRF